MRVHATYSRILHAEHVGEVVNTRRAQQIRKGIMLGRAGDIDNGLKLRGIAWAAFFRTKTRHPVKLSPLWTQVQGITISRETLLRRIDD